MKWILAILFLTSCGTAKDIYIDNKYDLCRRSCELKYSKYEYQKRSECFNKCSKEKYETIK